MCDACKSRVWISRRQTKTASKTTEKEMVKGNIDKMRLQYNTNKLNTNLQKTEV